MPPLFHAVDETRKIPDTLFAEKYAGKYSALVGTDLAGDLLQKLDGSTTSPGGSVGKNKKHDGRKKKHDESPIEELGIFARESNKKLASFRRLDRVRTNERRSAEALLHLPGPVEPNSLPKAPEAPRPKTFPHPPTTSSERNPQDVSNSAHPKTCTVTRGTSPPADNTEDPAPPADRPAPAECRRFIIHDEEDDLLADTPPKEDTSPTRRGTSKEAGRGSPALPLVEVVEVVLPAPKAAKEETRFEKRWSERATLNGDGSSERFITSTPAVQAPVHTPQRLSALKPIVHPKRLCARELGDEVDANVRANWKETMW